MALHTTMLIPDAVTRTLVCVDHTDGYEFSGRLVSPYRPRPLRFAGVMDMIGLMEDFFDGIAYPPEHCDQRRFCEREKSEPRRTPNIIRYHSDDIFSKYKGTIATFVLQVRFRRNATWQGSIAWVKLGRNNEFRSVLELVTLVGNAIIHTTGVSPPLSWEEELPQKAVGNVL